MPDVRLFLLDGFDLTIDGLSLTLQPAMQQVVAIVALAPRGVKRDNVAFQLWPDKSEQRAKANLRSCLWRIGKLPVNPVVASKTALKLRSNIWVDVREGMDDLAAGDERAIGQSMLPFNTLQADLLPDWYDDWLVVERERFRRFRLSALESKARLALSIGDTSTAIQLALASVSIDPHRAGGYRLAVEAHLAEGNAFEAQREFERYRQSVGQDSLPVGFEEWSAPTLVPVTVR